MKKLLALAFALIASTAYAAEIHQTWGTNANNPAYFETYDTGIEAYRTLMTFNVGNPAWVDLDGDYVKVGGQSLNTIFGSFSTFDGQYSSLSGIPSTFAPSAHTHSAATTSVDGFLSATDKTKLNGIATGATANASDSALRDRSTHTGSQLASTISDFTSAARSSISAGTGISIASGVISNTMAASPISSVYVGATSKTGVRMIAKSVTTNGSGQAIYHLTNDETSTGTTLCPNGNVWLDSMMVRADNEIDTPFSFGSPALSNSNKTVTIGVKKAANVTTLPIIGTLTGALLGAPVAATGSVIKMTVVCD